MNAPAFPLTLQGVVFVKSHVEAIPNHEPGGAPGVIATPPINQLSVAKVPESEHVYSITMHTLFNPERDPASPYMIEMECMAAFTVDEKMTEEEAKRGVTITGHNVVYGAIREAICWLTARQPYGPLMLGLSVLTPKVTTEGKAEATP
jgi:preprotein translocase subunit SecB